MNVHLGIRLDIHDASTTGSVFTDDVLKIEICSPKEDYLTIIDVPGIFRTAQGATTDRDIALVRKMVESHIRDPRTIILAVLPANVDFATQEILALAEKHDPEGERTLGVLTKPDLILEDSGKNAVCNLVLGKRKKLRLGYYLVCNRGPDGDNRSMGQRELMFNEKPWDSLPRERLGRDALKITLSSLLAGLTRSVFGTLRNEIQKELEKAVMQLDGLGSRRESEQEQRIFLSSIAGKFQALVTAARFGNYSQDNAFEEDPDLRLCTSILNLADEIVGKFSEIGHVYEFEADKGDQKKDKREHEGDGGNDGEAEYEEGKIYVAKPSPMSLSPKEEEIDSDPEAVSRPRTPVSLSTSSGLGLTAFDDDISDLLFDLPDYGPPQSGITDWIAEFHKKYRGPELISPSPAILGNVFKEQSSRWGAIGQHFVSCCVRAVHIFIRRALALLCPSPTLATDLWYSISDEVLLRYKASLDKAAYLSCLERSLVPYTLNSLFNADLAKSSVDRNCDRLKPAKVGKRGFDPNTLIIRPEALRRLAENEDTSHNVHKIHDALKAYYKIASQRFQDNLYMQAVNHGLVNGEATPLGVFSQEWVIGLSVGQLDELVGDSARTRAQRREVEGRKADLEKAVAILRG